MHGPLPQKALTTVAVAVNQNPCRGLAVAAVALALAALTAWRCSDWRSGDAPEFTVPYLETSRARNRPSKGRKYETNQD